MSAIDVIRKGWDLGGVADEEFKSALADLSALVKVIPIVREAHRYDPLNTEQAAAWLALSVIYNRVTGEAR